MDGVAEESTSSLNVSRVLVLAASMELDTLSTQILRRPVRENYSGLAVGDQFLRGTMNFGPESVNVGHQSVVLFVRNYCCSVPARAPVQHVENDVLVHEHQITLHLLIESVR